MVNQRTTVEAPFSQRYGYVTKAMQFEHISDELFNKLWMYLLRSLLKAVTSDQAEALWVYGLSMSVSDRNGPVRSAGYSGSWINNRAFEEEIRHRSSDGQWWALFDFIEFCYQRLVSLNDATSRGELDRKFNYILETESSAYRLTGGKVAPITDEIEISAIGEALEYDDIARQHLSKALSFISQKPSPDFENTVKEAISAVEALVKQKTGNESATLSRVINSEDFLMHASLKKAIDKLYGWASDEAGVRHGSPDKLTVSHGEAKFALVICSGIVNLIREMD